MKFLKVLTLFYIIAMTQSMFEWLKKPFEKLFERFDCETFIKKHEPYNDRPSLKFEYSCQKIKIQNYSVLEVYYVKDILGHIHKDRVLTAKLFKPVQFEKDIPLSENALKAKMFCVEITTSFIIDNRGEFTCHPITSLGYFQDDRIYNEFYHFSNEQMLQTFEKNLNFQMKLLSDQIYNTIEIDFMQILDIFKSFQKKTNEGEYEFIINEKKFKQLQVNPDLKLQQTGSAAPALIEEQSSEIKGAHGVFFYFQLDNHPLYFHQGTIYFASTRLLRIIIKSNNQEYDMYLNRTILFKRQGNESNETISQKIKDLYQFQLAEYLQQIAKCSIYINYNGDMKQLTEYKNEQLNTNQQVEDDSITNNEEQKSVLESYKKDNLLNMPVVVLMVYEMFAEKQIYQNKQHYILQDTQLSYYFLEPIQNENQVALDQIATHKWFYVEKQNIGGKIVKSLGSLYQRIDIEKFFEQQSNNNQLFSMGIEKQIEKINDFNTEYLRSRKNYFEFTIGLQEILRKMVIRIYGFEDIFYPNVLIQIYAQQFVKEHIIPLTKFEIFQQELHKKIKEAIDHYQDYVIELDQVGIDVSYIEVLDFKKILSQFLNKEHYCYQNVNDNLQHKEGIFFKIKYKQKNDFQKDSKNSTNQGDTADTEKDPIGCDNPDEDKYQEPESMKDKDMLSDCEENQSYRTTFVLYNKKINEKNYVYVLKIFEPKMNLQTSPSQNSFQIYKKYQYDYLPMLRRQIKSNVCHLLTNQYSRPSVNVQKRLDIFAGAFKEEIANQTQAQLGNSQKDQSEDSTEAQHGSYQENQSEDSTKFQLGSYQNDSI